MQYRQHACAFGRGALPAAVSCAPRASFTQAVDACGEREAQIFLSIQHFFCTNACKHFFVLLYSFSFGA